MDEFINDGWKETIHGNYRKNNQTRYKNKCVCGKIFLGVKNQVYCSNKCSSNFNNSKYIKYDDVLKSFEGQGYKVLTTKEEFDNRTENVMTFKIKFRCSEGHKYSMLYNNFNKGERCKLCAKNAPVYWSDVVKLFTSKGWKILTKQSEWDNASTKVRYECKKGHQHSYTYANLKFKNGNCPYCSNNVKILFDDIKKWFEDEDYKVLTKKNEYISQNKTPIHFICPQGHKHKISVRKWRAGQRCGKCQASKGEIKLRKFVDTLKISYKMNNKSTVLNPLTNYYLELDLWFPELNKAIEYNGNYWHSIPEKVKQDKLKNEVCEEMGIDLLTIWEDDWNNNENECKTRVKKFLT